jgi:hypothetical protein
MLWTDASGGDWDVAGNWVNMSDASDHHVPTSSDDAQINIGGITVTHASSASDTVNSLTVSSGTTLSLSNGTLAMAAASTIAGTLDVSGGELDSSVGLTVMGASNWSGGAIGGAVTNAGTMTVTGNGNHYLTGTLTNTGTIAVTGTGKIASEADNTTINNQAGATLDFQADASLANIFANTGTIFNNAGTLKKSAGTGTSSLGFNSLNDSGIVEADSGTLSLPGSVSGSNGAINANGSGVVILNGSFSGSFSGSGTGAVQLVNVTATGGAVAG